MKSLHKLGIGTLALATFATACTKDFTDTNTNPNISKDIVASMLLTTSQKAMVDRDFDWFYEHYQFLMRYMQYTVSYAEGNNSGMFSNPRVNEYYHAFYTSIGRNLVEIERIVNNMQGEEKTRWSQVAAIAKIHKVYSGFRVMDVNGSIPYTQALTARSEEIMLPKYDSQETLFNVFDDELKAAIAALTATGSFESYNASTDVFYNGDVKKWAKAANMLRLKLAMRLSKRNPEKLKAIVAEVMASPAGVFTSSADEWKFVSSNDFARGGNWNAQGSATRGSRKLIDFMFDTQDPRLGLFFKKNEFTEATFNRLKTGGAFPATAVYNPRQYVGLPESPDDRNRPEYAQLFGVKSYEITEGGKKVTVSVDTLSQFQNRLFDLGSDGNGNGQYTQPFISYAEVCFIMSELAVKGIITDDAKAWYDKGVTASVKSYDAMANLAKIVDYAAPTDAAIAAYLARPAIAFTGTNDEKLEKIGIQQYLNSFKSPWESWGYFKLLGYPKVGGILNRTDFMVGGFRMETPRRWPLPTTNFNQANRDAAIADMMKSGEYGNSVEDITGRVWWDKK
ncbi:SusD/RagB family nutrient-binding outer membrane lipoprotein [Chitinophaga deserti]|uniref:SusD/RagB family nutrient-binding outer membrane lipoprotein n=1 Tax=Chitinophaga deserti TaxID=2164099 RepID=UPI000D6BE9B8|nr:SusD/RagB family nutrient-binding outer membrane lipoprotein [Chitinophaga deserti]